MPPVGIEPIIPASEREQNYVLDLTATGIGVLRLYHLEFMWRERPWETFLSEYFGFTQYYSTKVAYSFTFHRRYMISQIYSVVK